MWNVINGSGLFLETAPGEKVTSFLSFGKVDTDTVTVTVTVMVPMAGLTTVSVLDADAAKKAGINLTAAKKELAKWPNAITKDTAPVAISRSAVTLGRLDDSSLGACP